MWEVLKNTQLWFGGSSHPYANGFKLRLKELRQAGSCLYFSFQKREHAPLCAYPCGQILGNVTVMQPWVQVPALPLTCSMA